MYTSPGILINLEEWIMIKKLQIFSILCLLIVGGCASKEPATPQIDSDAVKPSTKVAGNIPSPVTHSHQPVLPIETTSNEAYEELYSIAVEDFSVQGLLYSLAKNAKLNVDISPDISGIVTLNVIDQTLPMVLERIAKMANLRFEIEGPTLVVTPDVPYIHTYQINYLNIDRKMSSNLRLSSQISSAGSGVPIGDGTSAGGGGRSNIRVDNLSENNFWSKLESNVRSIIDIAKDAEKPQNSQQGMSEVRENLALEAEFIDNNRDLEQQTGKG